MATARPSPGWFQRSVGSRPIALLIATVALIAAACGGSTQSASPSGSGGARGSAAPSGAALGANSQPSDPALPFCKAPDMKAAIERWEGGAGSRFATVIVTSKSGVTCILRGKPGVRLLDAKNKILLDSAKIAGIGGPKVGKGDPEVVLGPGDELQLDVQWTNWCKSQPTRPLTVGLVLTDRGGLLKAAHAPVSGDDDAPACTSKSKTSEIKVTHPWLGPVLSVVGRLSAVWRRIGQTAPKARGWTTRADAPAGREGRTAGEDLRPGEGRTPADG